MGMYSAYFDASGKKHSPVLFVSGFVSSVKKWLRFEREWAALLNDFSIEGPFHTTDYVARQGQYKTFRGQDALCEEFEARAVAVIKRNTYKPFSHGLVLEDVGDILTEYEVPDGYTDLPYPFCAMVTSTTVIHWIHTHNRFKPDDEFEFVYEAGDDDVGVLQKLFYQHHRQHPIFRRKDQHPQFQAADILAWRHARLVRDDVVHQKRPRREPFFGLFRHVPHSSTCGFLGKEKIRTVLDAWGWVRR